MAKMRNICYRTVRVVDSKESCTATLLAAKSFEFLHGIAVGKEEWMPMSPITFFFLVVGIWTPCANENRYPSEFTKLWLDLGSDDSRIAYQAVLRMVSASEPSIAIIEEKLTPMPPLDRTRLPKLIAELGSIDFKLRERADRELGGLAELAIPFLKESLRGDVPLETRRRIEELMQRHGGVCLSSDRLRAMRACEVLERVGSQKSWELLKRLAGGAEGHHRTVEARASFARKKS